ncbi:MAG: ribosome biogenesis GTP-binding protein YihA/YsxC [Odoribacteraceae bacterium]|jgi:GTP-binding protein|nr:ribosome biogenesis GTP-binding protein YihA/YsxC [Odoribacteraceae bacterium]
MEIRSATFMTSNTDVMQCPPPDRREYAFIGRSNVGKSSLINMLTNNSKLAKTSSTPGKTQLINHFLINNEWYLVDLPGYGYVNSSKTLRNKFGKLISDYILRRENMVCLFVLVDSRHPPRKIDLEFMAWLGENGIPFVIVFTKADKLTAPACSTCIADYARVMLDQWESMPRTFLTSAESRLGREELLAYLDELNRTVDEF